MGTWAQQGAGQLSVHRGTPRHTQGDTETEAGSGQGAAPNKVCRKRQLPPKRGPGRSSDSSSAPKLTNSASTSERQCPLCSPDLGGKSFFASSPSFQRWLAWRAQLRGKATICSLWVSQSSRPAVDAPVVWFAPLGTCPPACFLLFPLILASWYINNCPSVQTCRCLFLSQPVSGWGSTATNADEDVSDGNWEQADESLAQEPNRKAER